MKNQGYIFFRLFNTSKMRGMGGMISLKIVEKHILFTKVAMIIFLLPLQINRNTKPVHFLDKTMNVYIVQRLKRLD